MKEKIEFWLVPDFPSPYLCKRRGWPTKRMSLILISNFFPQSSDFTANKLDSTWRKGLSEHNQLFKSNCIITLLGKLWTLPLIELEKEVGGLYKSSYVPWLHKCSSKETYETDINTIITHYSCIFGTYSRVKALLR